jgi:hypothetical protein
MVDLTNNVLVFEFPEVHEKASLSISFERTLRIPDDNHEYVLPPGLGRFPLKHVDDYKEKLSESWKKHGGVFLPIYQSEASWINFPQVHFKKYPCAIKVAAGKINAVTGEPWSPELAANPQDYLVSDNQRWLDGFNVTEDLVSQFVAMPLGEVFTAEEQLTGKAEHGGLQIYVYPMKKEIYREKIEKPAEEKAERERLAREGFVVRSPQVKYSIGSSPVEEHGLAAGGLIKQKIHTDEYGINCWDQEKGARCFVHLANSEQYQTLTGEFPPDKPPTARDYTNAGLPWFEYYSDGSALQGSGILNKLTGLAAKTLEKSKNILSENETVQPENVKKIIKPHPVREGEM